MEREELNFRIWEVIYLVLFVAGVTNMIISGTYPLISFFVLFITHLIGFIIMTVQGPPRIHPVVQVITLLGFILFVYFSGPIPMMT